MTQPPPPVSGPHQNAELLALFSTGELDAAGRDVVSAHLIDCDGCWSELEAQRAAIGAVHLLWEPAPTGLRADIRAAISAQDEVQPRPHRAVSRRTLLVAAAAVAVVGTGGVVASRLVSAVHRPGVSVAAALPASVQAAIDQSGATPPDDTVVPPAPNLSGTGLRLAASGSTTAGGITASRYTYAGRSGERVTVFVTAAVWPRPSSAASVSTTAWLVTAAAPAAPAGPAALTVVGGADQADDQMLVIAGDHTVAMTAAAALGLL